MCTNKNLKLQSAAIRRLYCFHSKQIRFKSPTRLLWMCLRVRRSMQIRLSPSPSFPWHKRQSSRWGQPFASVCTDFDLTRLKSNECVFVHFVNNSKSRIQDIRPNLANIIEATAFVPENDKICPDCPHATAIFRITRYVDDNTNCDALAAELEAHCKVKFPFTISKKADDIVKELAELVAIHDEER